MTDKEQLEAMQRSIDELRELVLTMDRRIRNMEYTELYKPRGKANTGSCFF